MDSQFKGLTKKERKILAKDIKEQEHQKTNLGAKIKNWSIIGLIIGILVIGGLWTYKELSNPLPGDAVSDLGREHTSDISGVEYNSNPPTSGRHFPVWAKTGTYNQVVSDGYLLHSLEHGYIVISYNCEKPISMIPNSVFTIRALAHEGHEGEDLPEHEEEAQDQAQDQEKDKTLKQMNINLPPGVGNFTPATAPQKEIDLPESFSKQECKDLVAKLEKSGKGFERIIIVPRPNMETQIALTAWGRILKVDQPDELKIREFIKAFHNKGPEQTQE